MFALPLLLTLAFQSTGPLRDPTMRLRRLLPEMIYFNPQVPCGTRPKPGRNFCSSIQFQSTGPLRDPTYSNCIPLLSISFQSTGPLRDPTVPGMGMACLTRISIHRSLAGPDQANGSSSSIPSDFNPQVPCGTRLMPILPTMDAIVFQSTGPLRDPTPLFLVFPAVYLFQSTGPLRDPTAS